MDAARDLFRRAEASNGSLRVDGEPLTSERVKLAIQDAFTQHGCTAEEFIVSHGAQSAIGHDMGSGAIQAGEPIVIDLWPKDAETACYADMTRTYCIGEIPDELREYHRLVKESLDRSLEAVRAGAQGARRLRRVLRAVPPRRLQDALEQGARRGDRGRLLPFARPRRRPRSPRAAGPRARGGEELLAGDVVTLEPGLYRRGWGGCRLEDLVARHGRGAEKLTDYPYDLEP